MGIATAGGSALVRNDDRNCSSNSLVDQVCNPPVHMHTGVTVRNGLSLLEWVTAGALYSLISSLQMCKLMHVCMYMRQLQKPGYR